MTAQSTERLNKRLAEFSCRLSALPFDDDQKSKILECVRIYLRGVRERDRPIAAALLDSKLAALELQVQQTVAARAARGMSDDDSLH